MGGRGSAADGAGPSHDFPFDPTYGHDLESLLDVVPPDVPDGFEDFWSPRYDRAAAADPRPTLEPSDETVDGMHVWDLRYTSADGFPIRGWLLEPLRGQARCGFVFGHGYGGLERPELPLPRRDAAYLVPCLRGLGRSAQQPISSNPWWHVRHDIQDRNRYILGGCVEDLWSGVSALLALLPHLGGQLHLLASSFGGGIGAMALAWERRIASAHLDVPTFGHQPLRLGLPSIGAGASVRDFQSQSGRDVLDTLAFYDAAVAARFVRQPTLVAAALFDPVVPPPGQFALHNALAGPRRLFVRSAGHHAHEGSAREDGHLASVVEGFFGSHEPRVPQLAQPASRP